MSAPRLFVIGDVSGPAHYHLGDEAMLEANLHMLRRLVKGIEFTVASSDPGWTSKHYAVKSLPIPQIPAGGPTGKWVHDLENSSARRRGWLGEEVIDSLRTSAGLLISGGGNLCVTWPEKVLERVALLETARSFELPAVIAGQTIGPALTRGQRLLLSETLPSAAWIGVRDSDSATLALSLGVDPARVRKQLDDAFFLDPLAPGGERVGELHKRHQPWIVVTLDASFGAPERQPALSVIASQLDALSDFLKASLIFVPHVGGAGVGEGWADAAAAEALAARLRSDLLILDLWQPREVRWLVEQAAMVISTRYHPIVFATAAAVPSLGIYTDAYTRTKLRGALDAARLGGWCLSIADAERGALLPLALELWRQRIELAGTLARFRTETWARESDRWNEICRAFRFNPQETPVCPAAARSFTATAASNSRKAAMNGIIQEAHNGISREIHQEIIPEEKWWQYQQNGYLRLGQVVDRAELTALQERMDAIMLGQVRYPTLRMQLDTGGDYGQLPEPVAGLPAATLAYRKVQGLESDPLVLDLFRRDLFREICARQYGKHASISFFRVMMMNKPAGKGTYLPWHQDAGDVWKLDRDPLVTLWVALDSSTRRNGCLQVISGSHRLGLLSKNGSTISAAHEELYCPEDAIEYLEVNAGEALLLHNWLLHRSDVNHTGEPRRALSVCYMDGRTLNTLTGDRFPIIFGQNEDAEMALPFLRPLREMERVRRKADRYQRFASKAVDALRKCRAKLGRGRNP